MHRTCHLSFLNRVFSFVAAILELCVQSWFLLQRQNVFSLNRFLLRNSPFILCCITFSGKGDGVAIMVVSNSIMGFIVYLECKLRKEQKHRRRRNCFLSGRFWLLASVPQTWHTELIPLASKGFNQ